MNDKPRPWQLLLLQVIFAILGGLAAVAIMDWWRRKKKRHQEAR